MLAVIYKDKEGKATLIKVASLINGYLEHHGNLFAFDSNNKLVTVFSVSDLLSVMIEGV